MDAKVQIKLKNENRKLKFDVIKHKKRAADESTALLFFPLGERGRGLHQEAPPHPAVGTQKRIVYAGAKRQCVLLLLHGGGGNRYTTIPAARGDFLLRGYVMDS